MWMPMMPSAAKSQIILNKHPQYRPTLQDGLDLVLEHCVHELAHVSLVDELLGVREALDGSDGPRDGLQGIEPSAQQVRALPLDHSERVVQIRASGAGVVVLAALAVSHPQILLNQPSSLDAPRHAVAIAVTNLVHHLEDKLLIIFAQ
jgi:hypothetical protein